jgi:hypothetical protein
MWWVLLLLVLAFGGTAIATGGSGSRTWVQDFEKSTAGWFNLAPGTIHRVPSGYVSPVGYASVISSAHGYKHARLRTGGCDLTRMVTTCFGPYTRWGKETSGNAVFPNGGFMTEVDIYLDVTWTIGKADYRFDWASAINDNTGAHQRDFVFNVGTDGASPGFWVNASTNATRGSSFPQNPCPDPSTAPNYCRLPVKITQSGWYTFRHSFYPRHHLGTDYLAVDFHVIRHSDGVVVGNWFISVTDVQNPVDSDRMGRIGGDRYGWFVINEVEDLAIDCSNLRARSTGHPLLRTSCFDPIDHDSRDNGDDGDEDDEYDEKERKKNHRWDED